MTYRDWREPQPVEVPADLHQAIGGHPLVAETLLRRGFADPEAAWAFLDPAHYRPASPYDLPDMARAVERLERAIRQQESICVWGDFDVDGQTATALLLSTLCDLGSVVRFYIPNRQRESHGVHRPVLERLIAEGVRVVLTCDTGVGAADAIAAARAQGVDMIVTDHHELPVDFAATLAAACAVVNPARLPAGHPLRELPGVGCAYKLAEALVERVGQGGEAARHLDLVALGIVADVAVLTGDTRYLLQRGLAALRRTERVGLRAMMEAAELNPDRLTEAHIGFVLAPRLNALGRLDDAGPAVELLTTDDRTRARTLAGELEGFNARRKLLCDQVTQAAREQIERDPTLLDDSVLVLSHPSWPGGIVGIVAARLANQFARPAVLIAAPPGEPARGSARSVNGCDITAAIAANRGLLLGFGGHPMAAGLSIDPARIPDFRRALSRTVREACPALGEPPALPIDAVVSLSDLSLDLVEQLDRLAPFGPGNPPLTLATRGLSLVDRRAVGRNGEHLLLTVADGEGIARRVIAWQGAGLQLPEDRFDLAYAVRASDYRGLRDVQVEWVDARPVVQEMTRPTEERPALRVVDCRQAVDPRAELARLRAQEDVLVWAEAEARAEVAGCDRTQLRLARTLAVWTTPPGPVELRAALEQVGPRTVVLFGLDPGFDRPEPFLKRLAGLVKRALSVDGGWVNVARLAAATGQREAAVRAGLAWLIVNGHVRLLDEEGGGPSRLAHAHELHLVAGSRSAGDELVHLAAQLQALLEETAAFRAHFARADCSSLLADR